MHPKTGEEYALARAERKIKPGYKGFIFDTSPHVTLEEDLRRRDLTINAMAEDLTTQRIIDPFGGQKDIQNKILRHVSQAFAEDPVRILRVGRFLARYAHLGFQVHPQTMQLMQQMVKAGEVDALVAERVWKELSRALLEKNPEKFFEVLAQCQALPILFPFILQSEDFKTLKIASQLTDSPLVRFAATFFKYSQDGTQTGTKTSLAALCDRYRIPNEYRRLVMLTAIHYQTALTAQSLSANALLKLFTALDIFRRPKRFEQFLTICQAIATSEEIIFNPKWLHDCAHAVKSVDVQALIAKGYTGTELAMQLQEKRKSTIEQWLDHN